MATELERQLRNLKQGDHVCHIYENTSDQLAAAVPFIKDGLARKERCIYIVEGRPFEELVVEALSVAGVDVDKERERGALRILTKRDSHLPSGKFLPEAMIAFWRHAEIDALADGFSGLRGIGEMSWTLRPEPGWEGLIEFEALVNDLAKNSKVKFLCQYNRSQFDSPCILDVVRAHPVAIVGDQVCGNPYYEPPEMIVGHGQLSNSEFADKRVDWWIGQLKRAQNAEQDRERLLERLQALSRRLLEVQEAERRHLALELHDEVGQLLTGLRLLLKPNGGAQTGAGHSKLEQALAIVDTLFAKVRRLAFDLRPAVLDQLGLFPALLDLFENYTKQTGVRVSFKHKDVERRFAPEVETTAYRIVQEALTNVARHARVGGVTVRIWATQDLLSVQIEDGGRGFDTESVPASSRSSGLAGMRERVMLLNGHLTIDSRPGKGAQITVDLPLPPAPADA